MYLHLGQNTVVRDREIIGIFDLDITSQSPRTRRYLNTAEQRGEVVFISQLSTATLLRRSDLSNGSALFP